MSAQQTPAGGSSSDPPPPCPPKRRRGRPRKAPQQEGDPAAERRPPARPKKKQRQAKETAAECSPPARPTKAQRQAEEPAAEPSPPANRSPDPQDKSPEASRDSEEESAPGNAIIVSPSNADGSNDGNNDGSKDVHKGGNRDDGSNDGNNDGSKDVHKGGNRDNTKPVTQCAPWTFYKEFLAPLLKDKEVLKLIDNIPFKTLFGMQNVHPSKKLMEFVMDCFQESGYFIINGEEIDVKKLVQKVIGLSNSGKYIATNKDYEGHSELRKLLTKEGKGVYAKSCLEYMKKKKKGGLDDLSRCIVFILAACSYFLAPRSNRFMDRRLLSIFENVVELADIGNMKWCDFIGELLIQGLIDYKRGIKKCHGCVYILAVIFYDLVTPTTEIIDRRFPRINHITQEEMNRLDLDHAKLEEKMKTAKKLSDSIYSQDYQEEEAARPAATISSLLKEMDELTSGLVKEVSAPPVEEEKLISDLKDNESSKRFQNKLICLEKQLAKQRATITKKSTDLQKLHKNLAVMLGQ